MPFLAERRQRIKLYAVIGLLIVLGLFYRYYNIFEERRINQFFDLVVAGDYPSAYKLWQPTPSYKYSDFLEDWGDSSFYAESKITSFHLESSHSKGNVVVIKILLNGKKEIALIVNKEDKHFSFAP
ncbi:MAG: hypothetical protein LAO31_17715 [Acidobacteriia bacterium]|nr:hypothetical protein [Terriglobia bacterium]